MCIVIFIVKLCRIQYSVCFNICQIDFIIKFLLKFKSTSMTCPNLVKEEVILWPLQNERNKKNVIESQLFVQYFQGNDEIIIYILKSKLLFRIHLAEAACSCCYK